MGYGKLIILIGVSNSGKSTFAHEQFRKDPENVVIINRDKLREHFFGFTESNVQEYYGMANMHMLEKCITIFEDTLIDKALSLGKTVIVDATHLKPKYLKRFDGFDVEIEYKHFYAPLFELLQRQENRTRKVPVEILKTQIENYFKLIENPKYAPQSQ
jgi:predicted kinase